MPTLHNLPTELLTAISTHLYMPDVGNLALSRLLFSRICSTRVSKQRAIQKQCTRIQNDSTMHWKDLLLAILAEPDVVPYVVQLRGLDWSRGGTVQHYWQSYWDGYRASHFTAGQLLAVQRMVDGSAWVRREDGLCDEALARNVASFRQEIVDARTMNILVLLLPLLGNLQRLDLHMEPRSIAASTKVSEVFRRIACSAEKDPSTNPLPHLKYLRVHGIKHTTVFALYALPSLQCIDMSGRDPVDGFGAIWEWADVPRIRASEMAYLGGKLEREMWNLKSAVRGPCVVRNMSGWSGGMASSSSTCKVEWLSIRIPWVDAPQEEWVIDDPQDCVGMASGEHDRTPSES